MIILDAGHGGKDPGAVIAGLKEKDLTLKITLYQLVRLKALGIKATATRIDDSTIKALDRVAAIRNSGAKYCISNHINAGRGQGVETIHSLHSSGQLATEIFRAIVAAGQVGRKVYWKHSSKDPKQDYYFMHRLTWPVDTVIVEYGFIDNQEDRERLLANWQIYAEAALQGFCKYAGLKYELPDQLAEDIKLLQTAGILSDQKYWLKIARPGQQADGKYVGLLIKNMANKLRGK